ncbi:uncharacterized protein LOC128853461 isoform X3 [Cuculus canorus]|uniref:uncharacterized protein LOC128853461 isoform X3 n=1 Tax=Cuculus canorus TaxID=55661 RepID=UPI0023AACE0A|nr:uncharacterized protein LOC128853461 isoform X3 [Cuculus canorus]
MRNKPPFPPCPPWFIFHFSLFQAPTCSLRTSPGGVWLVQGSRDCDGRAVPRRLAQPGSRSGCLWGSHTSRRDPAFQASELRGHGVHQGAALRRLSPTGMVGLLLICNAPHLTCALSQRPVPDLRKSCKVNAGVALPVKRDLEFPAQSRQCSASALKRSLEYLEIQVPRLFFFFFFFLFPQRVWRSWEHRENAVSCARSLWLPTCCVGRIRCSSILETSCSLCPQFLLSVSVELDAQEQRIYQLQTKQRERQAELEQKCSRIQRLCPDVEASHQLQEEAQKQREIATPAACKKVLEREIKPSVLYVHEVKN